MCVMVGSAPPLSSSLLFLYAVREQSPKFWDVLLSDLMKLVPVSLSHRISFHAMTLKDEVTPAHCVKFILDMIRCVKIQGKLTIEHGIGGIRHGRSGCGCVVIRDAMVA